MPAYYDLYAGRTEGQLKVISIKVPELLDKRIADIARRTGKTRSAVVREALEAYSGEREQTFEELAADLLGVCEGPEDLSTNPKYLDEFGN